MILYIIFIHTGDFRGTKDSLKKLVNEDRYRKPLMTDIWHFYRSERLYLLKTTKEIMTKTWKEGSKHHATFADIFNQMEELSIGQSLLNQLEYVTRSEYFSLYLETTSSLVT